MTTASVLRWTVALGTALGGFFDGILLHQILQWHHLLSGVANGGNLRTQIMWDGTFHLLMYALAVAALWGLWRGAGTVNCVGRPGLAGALLFGFGIWHILDALLSHWLLGIHRVRQDSPNPMLWDLIWLAVFGVVPVFCGWMLLRRRAPPPRGGGGRAGLAVASSLTLVAAIWSLLPPSDARFTVLVMHSAIAPEAALASLAATGSNSIWADPNFQVLVIDAPKELSRLTFFRHGAVMVSGGVSASACLNWTGI